MLYQPKSRSYLTFRGLSLNKGNAKLPPGILEAAAPVISLPSEEIFVSVAFLLSLIHSHICPCMHVLPVLGPVLGNKESSMNKMEMVPSLRAYILVETSNETTNCIVIRTDQEATAQVPWAAQSSMAPPPTRDLS